MSDEGRNTFQTDLASPVTVTYRDSSHRALPMSDSKLADKEAGLAYSPVEKKAQRGSRRTKQWIGWFACVALLFWRMSSSIERVSWSAGFDDEKACPQEAPLVPAASISSTLEGIYSTETFLNRSAAWLSGAVKIPYASTI